jgi:probable HAF family extracellular repeat protein
MTRLLLPATALSLLGVLTPTNASAASPCLVGILCATEWSGGSVINLGGLPGSTLPGSIGNVATSINDRGQVVGVSEGNATEWSGGNVIRLGGGFASSINDTGQVVGYSGAAGGVSRNPGTSNAGFAAEWSGGSVINLGAYFGGSGRFSSAAGINNFGQVVGWRFVATQTFFGNTATEWSGGQAIYLGNLPGARFSEAYSVNDAGQAVGVSLVDESQFQSSLDAVEWSGGSVVDLGGLPGSDTSLANSINNFGLVVGYSYVDGIRHAVEWSGGKVIDLGGLPGSLYSEALGINDAGQIVGYSVFFHWDSYVPYATEWSRGAVINLGGLADPGTATIYSVAYGINNAGEIVGYSGFGTPEPSTWSMMLLGLAGLGFAGYRRAGAGRAVLAA